jgi:enhancing lycopene biosynthesis protein 2
MGDDPEGLIERLGGRHRVAECQEVVRDPIHRIATCSASMRDDPISGIALGIVGVIGQCLAWARSDHDR